MKIRNFCMGAILLGLGLSGCSNDNEGGGASRTVEPGLPTSFTISISQPSTYAADDNATPTEVRFERADIFIYSGTDLVNHQTLYKDTDFGTPVDNVYTSTTPIETTTGLKEVYAGINMTNDMVTQIKSTNRKVGLYEVLNQQVADLTDASKGFVMFSASAVTRSFVDENDENVATVNKIVIPVARLVAKVTVQEGTSLTYTLDEGSINDLNFAIRNSNKLVYPFQKENNGTVIDPNWSSADADYNISDWEQDTSYVPVDANNTGVLSLNVKYAPENTSDKYLTRESTYASIRAVFIPKEIHDKDGNVVENPNSAKTFYTVTLPDGEVYYFYDLTNEAIPFAADNNGAISDPYVDGYCYYNMFLSPNNYYNVLRNTYYKTTIKSISGLGNPNPQDEGNTDKPIPTKALIEVDIDILEWNVVPNEYDL